MLEFFCRYTLFRNCAFKKWLKPRPTLFSDFLPCFCSGRIKILSGEMSSKYYDQHAAKHTDAEYAFDNVLTTFCHTMDAPNNTVTLNFTLSYVTHVEIVNRQIGAPYQDRLHNCKVKLVEGGVLRKLCGIVDTSVEKNVYKMECYARGNALLLELANQYLHVAEVRIYGVGELHSS